MIMKDWLGIEAFCTECYCIVSSTYIYLFSFYRYSRNNIQIKTYKHYEIYNNYLNYTKKKEIKSYTTLQGLHNLFDLNLRYRVIQGVLEKGSLDNSHCCINGSNGFHFLSWKWILLFLFAIIIIIIIIIII